MGLPDIINTTAAAFYGLALAELAKPAKLASPKDGEAEKTLPKPIPKPTLAATWNDASQETKDAFRKPVSFLQSYLRGDAVRNMDRDEVAISLAKNQQGTLVASVGMPYRTMVEVFCAMYQSLH